MNKAKFVVPRLNPDDPMIAIVEAEVDFSPLQSLFLPKLKEGVAAWINKTEEGKRGWDYSCGEFNVGDLSGCDYDPESPLGQELAAVGILNLHISTMSLINSCWHYDTILVSDPDKLEESA